MKEKIHQFIKKHIFGFAGGGLIAILLTVVFADTLFNSTDLLYTPPSNLGVSFGNITTGKQALDVLENMRPTVYYYAYGDPTASSPTDYQDIVNQGHPAFIRVSKENLGTANKEVCIVRNGELGCFKNGVDNWASNKFLGPGFFADLTCTGNGNYIYCDDGTYFCDLGSAGLVMCGSYNPNNQCDLDPYGVVNCHTL